MNTAPAAQAPAPLTFPSKAAQEEHFRVKLKTSLPWALRALELIYQHQTEAEKAEKKTSELNGVGFSGKDGQILSSFAQQVRTWNACPVALRKYPVPLSPKQQALLFRVMPRYAVQLIKHLGEKAGTIIKSSKVA